MLREVSANLRSEGITLPKRQVALLYLLNRAGGQASRLRLTKLSFLLRQAEDKEAVDGFYGFVPYHYGPYSFSLYHDVAELMRDGMVTERDSKTWSLTDAGQSEALAFEGRLKDAAAIIMEKYGTLKESALLDTVYERFPWYTLNSSISGKRRAKRPVAEPSVFTMGYEGLSIDDFLNRLLRIGVQRIIDVRRNPVSRRFGFHKRLLEDIGKKVAVEYLHFPELGIASEERQMLNSPEDYVVLFERYRKQHLPAAQEKVADVAALQVEKPSVLVCVEANPECCHRGVLAEEVSKANGLLVLHLGWPR